MASRAGKCLPAPIGEITVSELKQRTITRLLSAVATEDGAGVKLKRALGQRQSAESRLDPYLMMDVFFSDNPDDYIAGFPSHPHRGFETITYMLEGHMLHQDHMGNKGDLKTGGIQWMSAGRGVIHSEIPQQTDGRMRGFQIWLNLPKEEKMKPAAYQNFDADQLPGIELTNGSRIILIAGSLTLEDHIYSSPVQSSRTQPLIADLQLAPDSEMLLPIAAGLNALLYSFEGELSVNGQRLPFDSSAILSDGDFVTLKAGPQGGRAMLLAGKPLNEPVVQYGPFVMNTEQEIRAAIDDYNRGTFA